MWKKRRRQKLRARPFPAAWSKIIEVAFPLFDRLPAEDRDELRAHIQVFLAEKHFEGCGGLDVTEEMRVVIAAQACLLLLRRETDYYPGLQTILIYPSSYRVKTTREIGLNVFHESHHHRLGEAWDSGAVVLAWDAVRDGAANPDDGHNVVFHEFAHQLDYEDGRSDGAPLLGLDRPWFRRKQRFETWARVLKAEYEKLRASIGTEEQSSVLDRYGATNPAEFFAVATESFFERPAEVRQKHPALYRQLRRFYRQDPASWPRAVEPAFQSQQSA
ncbi:MAG TPA: M90 family metallopeptidase [Verrucomicrobiae bacterium]|nr:M90 family metallopeptidase [Verrucomicrobiae bacterium]